MFQAGYYIQPLLKVSMVMRTYNPRIREAEAGRLLLKAIPGYKVRSCFNKTEKPG